MSKSPTHDEKTKATDHGGPQKVEQHQSVMTTAWHGIKNAPMDGSWVEVCGDAPAIPGAPPHLVSLAFYQASPDHRYFTWNAASNSVEPLPFEPTHFRLPDLNRR